MSGRTVALFAATAILALTWPGDGSRRPRADSPARVRLFATRAVEPAVAELSTHRLRRHSSGWHGGIVTAPTGEQLTIYVSDSYAPELISPQVWAGFFAGLVHGSELSRLTAYIAPLAEVQELCGSTHALGCYGSERLAMTGEAALGISPETVARHEYGHHVAANAVNPPWRALDWGTKRWASYASVCARTSAGTAYPGDETDHYVENPGEAFAEVYRALNESKAGAASFDWPIVAASFYPDAGALAAVEQDVVDPWTRDTSSTTRAHFSPKGKRVWTLALTTPLDGDLEVRLQMPRGSAYELLLVSADGRSILAGGLWSGAAEKTVRYTICGRRTLALRVVRQGPAGRLAVHVSKP